MTQNQKAVIKKVEETIEEAGRAYHRIFEMPEIQFKKRGRVAGTANCYYFRLNFNNQLLDKNFEHFLRSIVVHEVAHLVCDRVYGPSVASHGSEWGSVMRALGISNPERCHSYKTTPARTIRRIEYRCSCRTHHVSSIKHGRILKGVRYTCNSCKSGIEQVDSNSVVASVPKIKRSTQPIGTVVCRETAIKREYKSYFSGIPCKHGHEDGRNTRDDVCKGCYKEYRAGVRKIQDVDKGAGRIK